MKKLRRAKKEAPPNEKPKVVKTHLRNMIVVPEMIGSIVGVYNGKDFMQVEIKVIAIILFFLWFDSVWVNTVTNMGILRFFLQPEMIGHYLGEFSITYKPVKHGRPGIGATHSSRFIPLK